MTENEAVNQWMLANNWQWQGIEDAGIGEGVWFKRFNAAGYLEVSQDLAAEMYRMAEGIVLDKYELVGDQHRSILSDGMVSIRNGVIYFGQHKPRYERLHILFDRQNKRVAFTEGNEYDGISYKVTRNKASGSYSIRARAFEGVLSDGLYIRCKQGYELQRPTKLTHQAGEQSK